MNNPEYCQNIYEAARALVVFYYGPDLRDASILEQHIDNLKYALEGKDGKP